ncbi:MULTISPECIES: response regulator transcription factor [Deefgea]|uniref:Response regulator n=1 Tax=Deefgea chitinilytica TaxID=570276 RepID=A0ABS2CAR4_9NEIS|nr:MULTISPECIES: response regulator [Deefgea]MBM5571241.1 response regulator [Deefgea chitinilytica]MBM9888473.1 response regulator [Deefgea sp. CFH1-16]
MSSFYEPSDLRTLLIEPSLVQSKVMICYLAELGITHVTRVDTAKAALELLIPLDDKSPNLVMSALYLADMTGIDLLNQLRNEESTQNLAFILISSETRPQVLEPVRQLGACAILPKPFTSELLNQALMITLDYLSVDHSLDQHEIDLEFVRVLVVDDSRAARNYMRKVLENMGIRNISEAENGHAGKLLLEENTFDLLITDYNMPEMDGKELVEYVRTQSWQSHIPILMVSSEKDYGRLAAVEQAGVSGICDKPFEPAMVKSLLERVLSSH